MTSPGMISILMPACAAVCWMRLGDAGHRLAAAHVHGDGEAVRQAGLGEQLLGLGHVELVGLVVERAEHALRQEVLVDLADALEQRVADRVVVDADI